MGIFDKLMGKNDREKEPGKKPAGSAAPEKSAKTGKKSETNAETDDQKEGVSKKEKPKKVAKIATKKTAKKEENVAHGVLIAPIISEKTTAFGQLNKYVFKVRSEAGKYDVKAAIEGYYGVSVTKVHIIKVHSKKRIHGRTIGWKQGFKKAVVTLRAGDTIGIAEGV